MAEQETARVLAQLAAQTRDTMSEHVAAGSRWALIGYPQHTNPGDLAIWLAAKALLRRCGAEIVYECGRRDYSRAGLEAAVRSGARIAFTGGGNFGDLWAATHGLRERVLADFPGVPFLQLPQSVHFRDPANLARTARLIGCHGAVTLLVRDEVSRRLATDTFTAPVVLCPDLALSCPLPAGATAVPPIMDILWIAREDRESRGANPVRTPPEICRVDWNLRAAELEPTVGESSVPAALCELRARVKALSKQATEDETHRLDLAVARDELARLRLARACGLLGRGRVIVTDALHAHLIGLMLGVPTILTDNRYGKLRATFDTFTAAAPLARWADTPAAALVMAQHANVQRCVP